MRDLKVVGLDVTGRNVICEIDQHSADAPDKFRLPLNEQLRAAVRGEQAKAGQIEIEIEPNLLRPRDIQARIRAGASVEQLVALCGGTVRIVACGIEQGYKLDAASLAAPGLQKARVKRSQLGDFRVRQLTRGHA